MGNGTIQIAIEESKEIIQFKVQKSKCFWLVFNMNKSVPRVSDFVSAQPRITRSVYFRTQPVCKIHGPCTFVHGPCAPRVNTAATGFRVV